MSTPPLHSDSCASVFSRSVYDTTCARCAIINKIIHLRRKRVTLGCSWNEQQAAESVAQALISRNGLAHAECIDRLYQRQEALASGKMAQPTKRNAMSRAEWREAKWRKAGGIVIDQQMGIGDVGDI